MRLKYQKSGLTEGAKEHLSAVEQKMYSSALKSGNKKAIKYLEDKISKGIHNANIERKQDIERLANEQGDEFVTRQRLERRAENQSTSPYAMSNRQNQQAILTSKQKNTKETLGNLQSPAGKEDRIIDNRKLTNFGVDLLPGIGDIKGIYEALKSGDKTGVALASLGVIPVGDAAKLFKPIIKKYGSNTEMFTDILKQAEEQGIKVDRESRLYKQIQDEIPGAKDYYTPKNIKELPSSSNIKEIILFDDNKNQIGFAKVNIKDGKIVQTELKSEFRNKQQGDVLYGKVNDYLQNKYGITLKQDNQQVGDGDITENAKKLWQRQKEKGLTLSKNIKAYDGATDNYTAEQELFQYKPLTDEQIADGLYLSTKSEEAQKGLKNSRVKDLVYHGTENNFTEFSPFAEKNSVMAGSQGIYTTANKDYAKKYARSGEKKVMPLFVSAKTPKENLSYAEVATINEMPENHDSYLYNSYNPFTQTKSINEEIVTFQPSQTKSLFREHLGKWDWNNPNIHKAVTGLGVAGTIGYNRNQKQANFKSGGYLTFRQGGNLTPNQPKRTPSHPTKSHVVLASENGKQKLIRFGQQGVSGSPKKDGESETDTKRRKSFKARHAKNIAKGKMSAAYWADKVKWRDGGKLNQGNKPMEFVLNKTNTVRDHTLDGYKIVNGKLEKDLKYSVSGYLRMIDNTKNMKQYGENLYSKLKNGGYIK